MLGPIASGIASNSLTYKHPITYIAGIVKIVGIPGDGCREDGP